MEGGREFPAIWGRIGSRDRSGALGEEGEGAKEEGGQTAMDVFLLGEPPKPLRRAPFTTTPPTHKTLTQLTSLLVVFALVAHKIRARRTGFRRFRRTSSRLRRTTR